jgi:hypothetical protein
MAQTGHPQHSKTPPSFRSSRCARLQFVGNLLICLSSVRQQHKSGPRPPECWLPHSSSGSLPSAGAYRETEVMADGSYAVSDSLLNALLNTASGTT